MNTRQLECIIQCDPILRHHVLGVFALNHLTKDLARRMTRGNILPSAIIVNTERAHEDGQHWFAVYVNEESIEIFDSLGFDRGILVVHRLKEVQDFVEDINFHHHRRHISKRALVWSHIRVQSLSGKSCGQYVVYYLLFRLRGWL